MWNTDIKRLHVFKSFLLSNKNWKQENFNICGTFSIQVTSHLAEIHLQQLLGKTNHHLIAIDPNGYFQFQD